MINKRRKRQQVEIESRWISMVASLFFSVPTAFLLWFWLNSQMAFTGAFMGTALLWITIGVFALWAFVAPAFFPSVLGFIWHSIIKIHKWWGW